MGSDADAGLPARGQVHLVFHALADTVQAHELASLNADERARAARFVFERDRARFVSGRHRLRELLGTRLGLAPAAVPLAAQAHGKPVLASATGLHFNLSHSQGLALFAFSSEGPLGVDIEMLQPRRDLAGLARTVFSAAEQAEWAALPAAAQPLAFTTLWARKEALLKALGTGLTLAPDSLHLGVHHSVQTLALNTRPYCGQAYLYPVPAAAPFAAALASLHPVQRLRVLTPQPLAQEA